MWDVLRQEGVRVCVYVCLERLRHVFQYILFPQRIPIDNQLRTACNVNTYREVLFYRSRNDLLAMDFRTSLLLSLLSEGPVSLSNV